MTSRAAMTVLADVEPRPVDWLWRDRIPLGMLTIFDGDPGLGKSTVLLDISARLSRGDRMPDGSPGPAAAGTVLLTAEDDLARVVRPRFDAARGDPSKVTTVRIQEGALVRDAAITAEDLLDVEEAIHWIGARLVIIDPLMAYLPTEVNSNRDQDVRRSLVHVRDLAERTGVAVVVVRHLNKAIGGSALYRGGGSIGIIGAARSGLLLAADPDAPDDGRVLALVKSNLAVKPSAIRLRLVQPPGHDFAEVEWGASCKLSAGQLLAAAERPDGQGAIGKAKEFLRDLLANGPVPAREGESEAAEWGIAPETLRRARRELGVAADKAGRPGDPDQHWVWSLSGDDDEGDRGNSPKGVIPRKHDLLRVPGRVTHSRAGTSPKKVKTSSVDPLRDSEQPNAPSVDAAVLAIDLTVLPLRIDDPTTLVPTPKEVTSVVDDPLRVSAFEVRVNTSEHSEEGQAREHDLLREVGAADWSGQPDVPCPECGGPTLQWSFARVCRSCHHQIAEPGSIGRSATSQATSEFLSECAS
jgi:hypothetical protein